MRATRVTSDEFQSAFRRLSDKARREPVTITQGGRGQARRGFGRRMGEAEPARPKVGATEDLPEEWLEAVLKAEVPAEYAYLNAELE